MPNGSLSYREWAIDMASFFVAPYIPLLFTPIPFSATLEIMSIFLLGLVVIIPTIMGGWNEFSDARILDIAEDGSGFCTENKGACISWFRKFIIISSAFSCLFRPSLNLFSFKGFFYLSQVVFLCALLITIMIASYFAERSNRKSFIQRKLLQVGADAFSKHNTARHSSSY